MHEIAIASSILKSVPLSKSAPSIESSCKPTFPTFRRSGSCRFLCWQRNSGFFSQQPSSKGVASAAVGAASIELSTPLSSDSCSHMTKGSNW